MYIRINLGKWGTVFAVPSCVVDEHIKIASPLQLKILLYLLRNSENIYSVEQLSEFFSSHSEDISDAIAFWVERGVLCNNKNEYAPVEGKVENNVKPDETETSSDAKVEPEFKPERKVNRTVTRVTKPNLIDSAKRVAADENLKHLLAEVESALSKPLSSGDMSIIVMLYDTCGLPPEVIVMLVHYCISINKGNMRTIQRIGVEWSDNGIDSLEKAENRIQQVKQSNDNWNMVKGVFGMKNAGSPTKKQLEYADKWVGEWHFSAEMLRTAYELCVDNTGDISMQYINKILKKWQSAGIFKVEDIVKLDSKKTTSTKASSKASYDIDELEKIQ